MYVMQSATAKPGRAKPTEQVYSYMYVLCTELKLKLETKWQGRALADQA